MLKMATKEEIYRLGRKPFDEFPAWIEMNPRYASSKYVLTTLIRAVVVEQCDKPKSAEPNLYTSHGNYRLDAYGISWRLWYANGRERPDGKMEWELFSWDKS